MERETETVSSKIPKNLRDEMHRITQLNNHLSESEFIRTAIKEKIQRDVNKDEYNALSMSLATLEDFVNDISKRVQKIESGE